MSFDFDFFEPSPQSNKEDNLEQVMQQLEQNSFDFDNFDSVPPSNEQIEKSYLSDPFKTQQGGQADRMESAREQNSKDFDFDNSRDIC